MTIVEDPKTTPPPAPGRRRHPWGRRLMALGLLATVVGIIAAAAGGPDRKAQEKLQAAIATTATTEATSPAAPAETLEEKLGRFFDQDPNLAGLGPTARQCAIDAVAPAMTTYSVDALLTTDHTDPGYQLAVSGAKLAAAGCAMQAD